MNETDRADMIAGYAVAFERALTNAGYSSAGNAARAPVRPSPVSERAPANPAGGNADIQRAVLAIAGGLAWSHRATYSAGRAVEQVAFSEQIRRENATAAEAAEKWRARYRLCVAGGGLYDFETGSCDG